MSAPRKLSAGPVRNDSIWSGKTERKKAQIPKPANVTHAEFERAQRCHRRSNVARDLPKSNANRSKQVAALTTQLPNAFCRLTLELSRPVAGRRTCASVAQSTWPTPRHGVGLNDLLGGGGCRQKRNPDPVSEKRSGKARTRTRELSAVCNRSDRVSCEILTVSITVSEAG